MTRVTRMGPGMGRRTWMFVSMARVMEHAESGRVMAGPAGIERVTQTSTMGVTVGAELPPPSPYETRLRPSR